MSQTLNSRLRVLVAKSFRAEKLYASLRSIEGAKFSAVSSLSEIANEVRAREWQRSYYELRTALNEILILGPQVAKELVHLRKRFNDRYLEDKAAVERGVENLRETVAREEFAHVLKLSVELIRHKARVQANKSVADELTAVLQASGFVNSSGEPLDAADAGERAERAVAVQPVDLESIDVQHPSNVIPLRRRVS